VDEERILEHGKEHRLKKDREECVVAMKAVRSLRIWTVC